MTESFFDAGHYLISMFLPLEQKLEDIEPRKISQKRWWFLLLATVV